MNDSNTTSGAGAAVCIAAFLLLSLGIFVGMHSTDDARTRLQSENSELKAQVSELKGELNAIGRLR